jgi:hypothetical protein
VQRELSAAIDKAGGVRALAEVIGISHVSLYLAWSGKRPLQPALLNHLGLRAVTVTRYERIIK